MTKQEVIQAYQAEIAYQKHMLENLKRWYHLLFLLSGIGLVLIYFFYRTNFPLLLTGILVMLIGILGMLLFGYGIYKGRQNVSKVIDDFESKSKQLEKL